MLSHVPRGVEGLAGVMSLVLILVCGFVITYVMCCHGNLDCVCVDYLLGGSNAIHMYQTFKKVCIRQVLFITYFKLTLVFHKPVQKG